jgi:hypothetical protein
MRDASALFVGDNAADSAVKASAASSGAFHSSSQGQGWQMSLWGEGDTRAAALKEALMGLNSNELTPIQALQWIMDQQHKIL